MGGDVAPSESTNFAHTRPHPVTPEQIPVTLMIVHDIHGKLSNRLFKVLLDSGGSRTMIHIGALPPGVFPDTTEQTIFKTIAGEFQTHTSVNLTRIVLPEFDRAKAVDRISAAVFDAACPYDVIAGRDFIQRAGIDLFFSKGQMRWLDKVAPMKPKGYFQNPTDIDESMDNTIADMEAYQSEIMANPTSPQQTSKIIVDLMAAQQHLDEGQQQQLKDVLNRFTLIFEGSVGLYPHTLLHLEIDDKVPPVHSRPYTVPKLQEQAFKSELKKLVDLGILRRCGMTEWAAPTFIIPKKDGRARWVSDFRALNRALKRRVYPLPVIQDVISRRKGYRFLTKLDLSMMYYAFELDEESKELCTIITPALWVSIV